MHTSAVTLVICGLAFNILGLRAEDCSEQKADIVFLIDRSSSIHPPDFQTILDFVSNVTRELKLSRDHVQVGAISFANQARIEFRLRTHTNQPSLQRGISYIRQEGGNTNTADALKVLRERLLTVRAGARPDAKPIGIVITDGGSDNPVFTAQQAAQAHEANITLFAIGIGKKANVTELRLIASDPYSNVFSVPTFQALVKIQDMITQKTCAATTEAPEPTTSALPELTTERMINNPEEPSDKACRRKDVVFVPPASAGSIQLSIVLKFIRIITDKLQVVEDSVQVGVVPTECKSIRGFAMDTHGSNDKLSKVLDQPELGLPDTAAQLRYLRMRSFSECQGARKGARKVAVVIVDHESNDVKETMAEAAKLKREGVEVFVVAVGKKVNKDEVIAIASAQSKYVISVACYDQLLKHTPVIISSLDDCSVDDCLSSCYP